MPATKYTYSLSADFPGGAIWSDTLVVEIGKSSIVTALDRIDTASDVIDIWFKDALSTADKTTLDGDVAGPAGGLIAAHVATPLFPPTPVKVIEPTNIEGIPYAIPKASGLGYLLNDRDVLLRTGIMDASVAAEDLRLDPSDNSQVSWEEGKMFGCYKRDDPAAPNGSYSLCADQADADTNASLSVYNYQALNVLTGDPISYEIAGGSLYVDLHKEGLGATKEEREAHRIYVLAAPDIPRAFGGEITFFDGYLAPWEQQWLPATSTDAARVIYNPAVPTASSMRVWIFYPPGMKLTHVIRFKLYRLAGV